jgi:hypothetical protein
MGQALQPEQALIFQMELALQVQLLLSRDLELALPLQWVRVRLFQRLSARQPVLPPLAPLQLQRALEPHRLPAILRMAWPWLPQPPLPLCCPRSHQ